MRVGMRGHRHNHRTRPATGHDQPQGQMATAARICACGRTHTHGSTVGNSAENAAGMTTAAGRATGAGMATATATATAAAMGMATSHARAGGNRTKGIYEYHNPTVPRSRSLVCAIGMALNTCWHLQHAPVGKSLFARWGRWDVKYDALSMPEGSYYAVESIRAIIDRRCMHSSASGP